MTPLNSSTRNAASAAEIPLELWGGVECTINRVGDRYFSQAARSGHSRRLEDLDRIAALGIRTLRFPILWEAVAPDSPTQFTWTAVDTRMARLRELGLTPIVGLLHHGSGPRYTDLVDPAFPALLARFAREVAQRFPEVQDWTPVNEPLTTARFSGLYGHWYPHGRNPRTFARALLNQTRGIISAMEEIRAVIPQARLIQTEDLGETQCAPGLEYQAEFENERRWLSFDLLSGKLRRDSPLAGYLREAGIAPDELRSFDDQPCPPDVLGVNHYVTSSRYLDGDLEQHPVSEWGSNGIEPYVDCAAVRTATGGMPPLERLLSDAWERYRTPIAVTESHLGCTREEQMRWLLESWQGASTARSNGVPVLAVTAWALFGSYDWDSLLTEAAGHYEPGAFDTRSEPPRPTALARLMRDLSDRRTPSILAGQPGWWRRSIRCLPQADGAGFTTSYVPRAPATAPLLISGGATPLGEAVARLAALRGLHFRMPAPAKLDFRNESRLRAALTAHRPWALVHAGGFRSVEQAAKVPVRCFEENVRWVETMARVCAELDLPLLTFSSDQVFDGAKGEAYVESDLVAPVNTLGRSHAVAEAFLGHFHPRSLIIRTGGLFGPWDEQDFVSRSLAQLRCGKPLAVSNDLVMSPAYLPDLVHAALDLLIDGEQGIWHLANSGQATWHELVCAAATAAGEDNALLSGRPYAELPLTAAYPRLCSLRSERGQLLGSWEEAVGRYLHARGVQSKAARQSAEMALPG